MIRETAQLLEDAGLLAIRQGSRLLVDGWTLQTSDHAQLATAVDEATIEAANAGTPWFAAVVKRRRKNVRDAYVVMPLWLFVDLVKRLLGMDRSCRHCGRAA